MDQERLLDGFLELNPNKSDEAVFSVRNREGIRFLKPGEVNDRTISVPSSIILKKVK